MKQRPRQVSIGILLVFVVSGYACLDSATDIDSGPAVIEGYVERVVSSNENDTARTQIIEGAVVTAARIADDGSLETIGGAEAETGSQGEFTLEVPGEDMERVQTASRIVIVARSGEDTGKAFVSSNVQSGSSVQAKPVTIESSAETEVLEEVVARGEEGRVTNADIEAAVDSVVAVHLADRPDAAADLAALLGNQAALQTMFYDRAGVEVSADQQEEIEQIKSAAQVELENRLHDLQGAQAGQEDAFYDFLETIAGAGPEAGVEPAGASKASRLSSLLVTSGAMEFPEEVVTELFRSNSFITAWILDEAVQNQLEALGAESATINTAADAAGNLQAEIRDGPATSAEEIRSLFSEYRNEIATAIENDVAAADTTFSIVNDNIGGNSGAKAAFDAAVEGVSDPAVIVEAYMDFNVEVQAAVNTGFDGEESENIEAYAELLLLLNIVS